MEHGSSKRWPSCARLRIVQGQPESQPEGPQRLMLFPGRPEMERCRRGEGGEAGSLAARLEENLRSLTGDKYVHHGVGCDVCGECCCCCCLRHRRCGQADSDQLVGRPPAAGEPGHLVLLSC